jgi:kynurenine formamidase
MRNVNRPDSSSSSLTKSLKEEAGLYKDKECFIENLPPGVPFRIADLTHSVAPSIPSWDNETAFMCKTVWDYEDGGFRAQRFEMMAGTGTHMDAPSHPRQGGATIADIPLKELVLPCVVIDVSDRAHEQYSLSTKDIAEFEEKNGTIPSGSLVIVHTGWDRLWNEPAKYRNSLVFPSISKEAGRVLLKRGIQAIGIDTLSPDRPEDGFPVHKMFSKADKYIIENIAHAHLLPPVGCTCMCLPLKIENATECPVRLVALIPPGLELPPIACRRNFPGQTI